MGIYMHLFLSLVRKKKVPKRKDPGCARRATPADVQAKRQKLASLKQSAVLYACPPSSASRPPVNAGEPCGIKPSHNERGATCRIPQAGEPVAFCRMARA